MHIFGIQSIGTVNTVRNINKLSRPCFCGGCVPNDSFEKRKSGNVEITLFNPFSNNLCNGNLNINLCESGVYKLKNPLPQETPLIIDYDPSRTGVIYNKMSRKPISVNVLKTTTENFPNSVSYHFMSKNLSHEYGYVHLYKAFMSEENNTELTKDYEDIGVVGDRVEVLYLRNYDDKHIGGIGKLADKMAVKYCLEEGFEPNIVSYADTNSHVAHFKRGKRFIPPEKGSEDWEFLKNMYGQTDPNVVLKNLIEKSEQENTDVDLTGWGYLIAYMPKDIADKYR